LIFADLLGFLTKRQTEQAASGWWDWSRCDKSGRGLAAGPAGVDDSSAAMPKRQRIAPPGGKRRHLSQRDKFHHRRASPAFNSL
jgi:hypothetical protein